MIKVMQKLFGGVVNEQNYAEFAKELGKRFIPKAEYNAKLGELKEWRSKAEGCAVAAEELAGAKAAAAELERQVNELNREISAAAEAHRGEMERMGLERIAERELVRAGAKNLRAAAAMLDLGAVCGDTAEEQIGEQVAALKAASGTAFLFESREVPEVTDWYGFVPAAASDISEEGYAGGFKLRLAEAHNAADCLSAIRVKQEAASQGVIL